MGDIVAEPETRDFSQPFPFDLSSQIPNKTVDIGRAGVSLSLDHLGRILQASTFHPKHGIIVAVPFEQFDGERFYDPQYVRSYRTRMLQCMQDNTPGFGLDLGSKPRDVSIDIQESDVVTFRFVINDEIQVLYAVRVLQSGEIVQTVRLMNKGSATSKVSYQTNLCISLNRASYGQLTEGGPVPLPESYNILRQGSRGGINILNPKLDAQLICLLQHNDTPRDIHDLKDHEARGMPLHVRVPGTIDVAGGSSCYIQAKFKLIPTSQYQNIPRPETKVWPTVDDRLSPWKSNIDLTTYILRRNMDYIFSNCTIPISDEAVCVITDHVALPLGWNRDNYWQIRLLCEGYQHSDILFHSTHASDYMSLLHKTIKAHLNWVYKVAQRPYGFWHRSYLVNGKPKDNAIFQLDQQCYPLLELCDYLDYFPTDMSFVESLLQLDVIPQMLQLLESKRDDDTGLWPTDETPGDDAVIYPYHFSSHVLLWHTLSRLQDLYSKLQSSGIHMPRILDRLTASLRDTTIKVFTVTRPDTRDQIFAYLTDGKGNHTLYHDANDIPTLFAPEWGFVSERELSIWHNTMSFGLSPDNKQGYCSTGLYLGLGSVHSPGAWVLGYYQELAYAASRKQENDMREAWRKIGAAMHWDGTFSEAVNPYTAECSSKAWFSWPGAMIGALVIRLRREGLEDILLSPGC